MFGGETADAFNSEGLKFISENVIEMKMYLNTKTILNPYCADEETVTYGAWSLIDRLVLFSLRMFEREEKHAT